MVTARSTGSRADSFKTAFDSYLVDFATTVTVNKTTETKDSMKRVIGTSTVSTTIRADIQWVNKRDLSHLNVGDVRIGDGMLFVDVNANIDVHDEIVYNSKTWRIVTEIEGEQVGGEVVYKGYIIRKNAQS